MLHEFSKIFVRSACNIKNSLKRPCIFDEGFQAVIFENSFFLQVHFQLNRKHLQHMPLCISALLKTSQLFMRLNPVLQNP